MNTSMLAAENFSSDATITFVPTAAGGTGTSEIAAFLKSNRQSLAAFFPSIGAKEGITLKNRFSSSDSAVEEFMIKFPYSTSINWLLPGVRPNNATIQLAVISSWTFADEKVTSWRVYWDQATVMRQLGMLPSDPSKLPLNKRTPVHAEILPVLTGNQMSQRYLDETAHANPMLEELTESNGGQMKQFDQQPTTHSFRRGVQNQQSASQESVEGPPAHTGRRHDPHANESHFSFGYDSGAPAEPFVQHTGRRHNFPQNETTSQADTLWASSSNGLGTVQSRPSSRVLQAPGGKSSIQLF